MSVSIYQQQALDFANKYNVKMTTKFLGNRPYWPEDKDSRDVWEITLSRPDKKPYVFTFGQSLATSNHGKRAPTLYDVLSCLTKYDPGTHADFCGDMGLDTDSRRGLETYLHVQGEWKNVSRLFDGCLDDLAEIN